MQQSQTMVISTRSSNTAEDAGGVYLKSNANGTTVKRIRSPHKNDVLCGRGGGINSHPGNRVFRLWVSERKHKYNTAGSKAEKTLISREVVEKVGGQSPPGRFLIRDGSSLSSWWVEIDDGKAMAKTSQALREGASEIRAQVETEKTKVVVYHNNETTSQEPAVVIRNRIVESPSLNVNGKRTLSSVVSSSNPDVTPPNTVVERLATPPPTSVTPMLQSVPSSPTDMEPLYLPSPPPEKKARVRSHSLILSGLEFDLESEFVNPFENEEMEHPLLRDKSKDPSSENPNWSGLAHFLLEEKE